MKAIATIDSEKDLGRILKTQRKICNVTQKQLADFCNLSNNGMNSSVKPNSWKEEGL
jgi:DNA-binding XRE family transcriptional regulator